jgi:hypothetical protein
MDHDGQRRLFSFSPDGKLMFIGDQSNRLFPRQAPRGRAVSRYSSILGFFKSAFSKCTGFASYAD